MHRRGNVMGTTRFACWLARAAARCCSAASPCSLTRTGKLTVLVDVVSPEAKEVSLFVAGPTPDWSLPVPELLNDSPPRVKRFAFELEGLPPGANPEGAALKLTLLGGDRSYEFNVNLN